MFKNTDYIDIGAVGFAQVGTDDYFLKNKVEKKVLFSLLTENKEYAIPNKYRGRAHFQWKSFPHDFGTYHSMCIIYDRDIFDINDDDPEEVDNLSEFTDWLNACESADFETEEMFEKCRELCKKLYPMIIVHKKTDETGEDNGLVAV